MKRSANFAARTTYVLELFDGQHFALQRDRAERAEFLGNMDSHDIVSAFVPTAQ